MIPVVMLVVIMAWVVSMAGEKIDPTGIMNRLVEMEKNHKEAVKSFLGHLKLDYHPEYGRVPKHEMPVHASGWHNRFVPKLFPKSTVVSVESLTQAEFSGTALTAHKSKDGRTFYVWHRYINEMGVFVTVKVKGSDVPRTSMAVLKGGNPVYLSSEDLICRIDGHMVSMRLDRW